MIVPTMFFKLKYLYFAALTEQSLRGDMLDYAVGTVMLNTKYYS